MLERIKTVVIILLTLSLFLLLFVSFSLSTASYPLKPSDMVFELFGRAGKDGANDDDGDTRSASAFPCQIAVSNENGVYMPQNPSQYDEAYQFVSLYVEEAVGSASDLNECGADEYKEALKRGGILFVYDRPLPFGLFYAWYNGGVFDGDLSLISLYVCDGGDRVNLYLRDPDGRFFRFSTESGADALRSVCGAFTPNGVFTFDMPGAVSDRYSPLPKTAAAAPSFLLLPPAYERGAELSRDILEDFSINFYLISVYNDENSVVYVEGQNTLRLYDDGRMVYTGGFLADESLASREKPSVSDILSAVYPRISSLWQKTSSGGSVLSLASAEKEPDGRTVFTFDACIGGCTVEREYAACTVVTDGSQIIGLSLYPLRFAFYESVNFLPYAQASAAAAPGSFLRLQYVPDGSGFLIPRMRCVEGGAK
ncbi:MAG: hypothetical protein IJS65_01920 [Clostridia bacterium]|nr:hypothetical protein [Clostridia bacterium]